MEAIIFGRMTIIITHIVAQGRSSEVAHLMCHSLQTADNIYLVELYTCKVCMVYCTYRFATGNFRIREGSNTACIYCVYKHQCLKYFTINKIILHVWISSTLPFYSIVYQRV